MRVHPGGKLVDINGAKVNGISDKVKLGDHGGVYLDDGPILRKAVTVVETDGGRQGDMTENTFLFVLPIPGDVGEQLLEGCDSLLRLFHSGLDRSPLRIGIVLVLHLVSNRQSPLELLNDDILSMDRGLDSLATSLKGSLAHQHDLPTGLAPALAELVELVLFLIGVEKDVPCREKVEDAGFGGIDKEKSTSALAVGGLSVADRDT